jgi:hypothetical protein
MRTPGLPAIPNSPFVQAYTRCVKTEIETALSPLVGLELIAISPPGDAEWLTFGRHGDSEPSDTELAPFALRIECAWRLLSSDAVVTGNADNARPASTDTADDALESSLTESFLLNTRHQEFREKIQRTPYSVLGVEADRYGGVRMELSFGCALEIFPSASTDGDELELWRVFQPGLDYSHFVVSTMGVDRVSDG